MKISEKMLEDWICENPEELYPDLMIIGRQVKLEHGVLDLLAHDGQRTLAIELKAKQLKEANIAQVLRYSHDVSSELSRAGNEMIGSGELSIDHLGPVGRNTFYEFWNGKHECRSHESLWRHGDSISPILIGTGIDRKILAAARQANIDVYLWRYAEDTQTFTFEFPPFLTNQGLRYIPDWARKINHYIYDDAMELTESFVDYHIERLFETELK